ncbi:MAG TPA: efflux RND transporter permease subunit [Planktothrix sp.]|jgi:hydrophobe/amphiphile efflux-1 (HAE1) family protein
MELRRISAWSITNPVPTTVLFLILTVAGLFAFFTLGIDESPNIDLPLVTVTVTEAGAAPSELETQVTRKIEDAVAGIGNIKHISSTVNEGVSATTIEFVLGTNSDRAVNDVRNEVSKIRQELPQGIDEPVVNRLEFTGSAFVTYTVSSEHRSVEELSWMIDNDIGRNLLSVAGVGQVQRSGGVDREINVDLNPTRLNALGISADMVSLQVRALNIDLPGGRGELGAKEQAIRTLGSAKTVDDLAQTHIMLPNGTYARLNTLGTVTDGTSDQRQLALLNGKPVVAFSIVRSVGSNMVDVENGVDAKLKALQATLPPDVKINKIRTEARFVHESYDACLDSLFSGAILAIIVIYLFLRDWRAALISALAMPLSLIPAFAVMKAGNFTLNNMSLLGLSLVIGVLVDDAIVEIENICRHINMGKRPYQAALDAADEIGLAVVATTMTIIVTFIPVAFMGGIPGQFLRQFGLTVAAAVFFSLLVARMLTPLMAAYYMKAMKEHTPGGWLMEGYDRVLNWCLRRRLITVIAGIIFFAASIALFRTLPTSVIGNVDRNESLLTVELAPGATLEDTTRTAMKLTKVLQGRSEVTQVFATLGTPTSGKMNNGASAGEVNKATIYISLLPREKRKLTQEQFEQSVRPQLNEVPGARLAFTRIGGITGKLRVVLTSDDGALLNREADKVANDMRTIAGINDIISSASLQRPEILVKPNFAESAEQGVSVQAIAHTAMIATLADIDANLPKFNLSDRQINIRVQLDPKYRKDLEIIRNLRVVGKNLRLVPLSSVASVEMGSGPAQIDRLDRARQVTIEASLAPNLPLGQALALVHKLPSYKALPSGILDTPSGDVEIQKDIFTGFGQALAAAVLLIYAVLVLLFEGYLQPFTIMMSLPLALGGALIALVLANQSLGFYALIGIVMLMGLVTKNAILLVEYCIMAMRQGKTRYEAIVESGEARMRPILMTTVAMIAGMSPIALGLGAGSEARAPMAICVVGGLVTSTALTLIIVPVVFTYIDDFQNWVVRFLPKSETPDHASSDQSRVKTSTHK